MSNRDLVIFLGSEFEKRGYDYLEKVRQRDPLFYQHYLLLRSPAGHSFARQRESDRLDPFTIAKEAAALSFYIDVEKLRILASGKNPSSHPGFREIDTLLRAEMNEFLPNLGLSYDSIQDCSMGFYSVSDKFWADAIQGLEPTFKDSKYLMSARFNKAVDIQKLIQQMRQDGQSLRANLEHGLLMKLQILQPFAR